MAKNKRTKKAKKPQKPQTPQIRIRGTLQGAIKHLVQDFPELQELGVEDFDSITKDEFVELLEEKAAQVDALLEEYCNKINELKNISTEKNEEELNRLYALRQETMMLEAKLIFIGRIVNEVTFI